MLSDWQRLNSIDCLFILALCMWLLVFINQTKHMNKNTNDHCIVLKVQLANTWPWYF